MNIQRCLKKFFFSPRETQKDCVNLSAASLLKCPKLLGLEQAGVRCQEPNLDQCSGGTNPITWASRERGNQEAGLGSSSESRGPRWHLNCKLKCPPEARCKDYVMQAIIQHSVPKNTTRKLPPLSDNLPEWVIWSTFLSYVPRTVASSERQVPEPILALLGQRLQEGPSRLGVFTSSLFGTQVGEGVGRTWPSVRFHQVTQW